MHGYTTNDMIPTARRLLILILMGVTIGALLTPMIVTESALRITGRSRPDPLEAGAIARGSASTWEPARIVVPDGTALEGWLFKPRQPNGSGVILLHGV